MPVGWLGHRGTGGASLYDFEWHPGKAASNWRKHGVEFNSAATVFQDPFALSVHDQHHSQTEERWVTTGESRYGQLLVVVHTFRQTGDRITVRIISARPAGRNERRQYESGA